MEKFVRRIWHHAWVSAYAGMTKGALKMGHISQYKPHCRWSFNAFALVPQEEREFLYRMLRVVVRGCQVFLILAAR